MAKEGFFKCWNCKIYHSENDGAGICDECDFWLCYDCLNDHECIEITDQMSDIDDEPAITFYSTW